MAVEGSVVFVVQVRQDVVLLDEFDVLVLHVDDEDGRRSEGGEDERDEGDELHNDCGFFGAI